MDFIGKDQRLPITKRGDVLLVPSTWASGVVATPPVAEKVLPVAYPEPLGI